jgi:hypothetical protein
LLLSCVVVLSGLGTATVRARATSWNQKTKPAAHQLVTTCTAKTEKTNKPEGSLQPKHKPQVVVVLSKHPTTNKRNEKPKQQHRIQETLFLPKPKF